MESLEKQLSLIRRGAVEIISETDLEKKINYSISHNTPLRIKLGADPSAPDIHFGHVVILRKLKQFQELGHDIFFLIGDFTGRVGDPSGRDKTRRPLTSEEVMANAETYKSQISRVLDIHKMSLVFNSNWLSGLRLENLMMMFSRATLATILEHNTFKERFQKNVPIHLHEFLYPFLQAYDSIYLKADIELGGTDQTFNICFGRELQKHYGQDPQVALTMPLLLGTDGKQKMSKSLGNYISLQDPALTQFHKLINIPDHLIENYFELLTDLPIDQIRESVKQLKSGGVDPQEVKVRMAHEIMKRWFTNDEILQAMAEEKKIHLENSHPENMPVIKIKKQEIRVVQAMAMAGLVQSLGEAKRLIRNGGVSLNNEKISDEAMLLPMQDELILKSGKRNFIKIIIT